MTKKTISVGFVLLMVLVALLLAVDSRLLFFASTMVKKQEIVWQGGVIKLKGTEFFFPKADDKHVFVQKLTVRDGMIEVFVRDSALVTSRAFFEKECEVRKCDSFIARRYRILERSVTAFEYAYPSSDSADGFRATHVIEGCASVLRYFGNATAYRDLSDTIQSIVEQLIAKCT